MFAIFMVTVVTVPPGFTVRTSDENRRRVIDRLQLEGLTFAPGHQVDGNWELDLAPAITDSYMDEAAWARFLAFLHALLVGQPRWMVVAISDADQQPMQHQRVTVDFLIEALDELRTSGRSVTVTASPP